MNNSDGARSTRSHVSAREAPVLALLNEFVERVLNRREEAYIDRLFSHGYVDHQPVDGRSSTSQAIVAVLTLLNGYGGDTQFFVERSCVDGDYLWYKLFGEGLMSEQRDGSTIQSHVMVEWIGVFRVRSRLFVERWGPLVIRRSEWPLSLKGIEG